MDAAITSRPGSVPRSPIRAAAASVTHENKVSCMTRESAPALRSSADHIAWLLAHPGTSEWLKAALRSAQSCKPVTLLNNLEVLRLVLGREADEHIGSWLRHP